MPLLDHNDHDDDIGGDQWVVQLQVVSVKTSLREQKEE